LSINTIVPLATNPLESDAAETVALVVADVVPTGVDGIPCFSETLRR
jgi:hypothetical protein